MENNFLDSSKQAQITGSGESKEERKASYLSITLKYLCLATFCFDFFVAYNLVSLVL